MAGPQFVHLQTFSRKANKAGQSVQQVLEEAARRPEFSQHVDEPQAPNVIEGLAPSQVLEMHDEIVAAGYVEANLKDGTVARRGIRKDRHTLLTAVASYPVPRNLVEEDQAACEAYKRWMKFNVRWLKNQFRDKLVSIVEHVDEQHPHLHAFVLPLDDPGCNARRLNPAWQVKEEAEALAKESGKPPQEAVKFGNRAYRAKGREIQDHYFQEVGLPSGLTRTGPKGSASQESNGGNAKSRRVVMQISTKRWKNGLRSYPSFKMHLTSRLNSKPRSWQKKWHWWIRHTMMQKKQRKGPYVGLGRKSKQQSKRPTCYARRSERNWLTKLPRQKPQGSRWSKLNAPLSWRSGELSNGLFAI